MAKKGLGRGLGVIFGSETDTAVQTGQRVSPHAAGGDVSHETPLIDISLIEPGAAQPRKSFDEEGMRELADSISQHGVLQPILLRRRGTKFEIIVGERRWRAAKLAGLKAIPAVVRDMDPEEAAEAALIENIQREDLSPLEEARALKTLIDEFGLTQEALAQKVSMSRAAVANSLRLLRLEPEILSLIDEGKLTPGHARAVLGIGTRAGRLKAARTIAERGLSVREAERLSKRLGAPTRDRAPARGDDELTRYYRAAEETLKNAMSTRVSIRRLSGESGRIEIEYYSHDELNAIIDKLAGSD